MEIDSVRKQWQVLVNGGLDSIFTLLFLFLQNDLFYFCYLVTLSAVYSVTWSTEIGTWVKSDTYNILNLKPVVQGSSGGISVIVSLGGIAGSIIIAL
jgi:uncharacterized membrane protein